MAAKTNSKEDAANALGQLVLNFKLARLVIEYNRNGTELNSRTLSMDTAHFELARFDDDDDACIVSGFEFEIITQI